MSELRFTDFSICDPDCEDLVGAMWTARYDRARVTREHTWLLLSACEGYVHLTMHPAGTNAMVQKLRRIRRALAKRRKATR